MKTIKVSHIEQVVELLHQQEFDGELGRHRSHFIYRGLPDVSFELKTSLQRNCKDKKAFLEHHILDNFAKYSAMEAPGMEDSVWSTMIIGQHHGLPTRLLDWSNSPLMAMHFATSEANMDMMDQRDCVIWRVDVLKINERLPKEYQAQIEKYSQRIFTVKMLNELFDNNGPYKSVLEKYDLDMGDDKMVILEPPSIDMRIANQYSSFAVIPSGMDNIEKVLTSMEDGVIKYIIDKNLRWEIRDLLDHSNINERVVYPGLDGIATWIGRHYFVRNMGRLNILKNNVATKDADIVVNSTNTDLAPVGAVCESIYRQAGYDDMLKSCKEIGHCDTGNIVVTPGFNLKAEYVFHAVAPKFSALTEGADSFKEKLLILGDIYKKALEMTLEMKCHSIAFPLLSSGANGCPMKDAWEVAIKTCMDFLEGHRTYPLEISFCAFDLIEYQVGMNTKAALLESRGEEINMNIPVGGREGRLN